MKVGDVVRYEKTRWRVMTHSAEMRTCILLNFQGVKVEVPDDLDSGLELKVLYNPEDWPFAAIPVKTSFGRVVSVTRSKINDVETASSETVTLEPMVEWIPGDFFKAGGSIFFNPRLQLKPGEILQAVHQNGKSQRITITRGFATMKTRTKRTEKPAAPLNNYQRILRDDVFGKD